MATEGNPCKLISVIPDYYEEWLKACIGGWASVFLDITPDGTALPCHSVRQLPVQFPNVRKHSLCHIWYESFGFNCYRGDVWMPEPCRSCEEKKRDHGGYRCQAFLLIGDADAADPACAKSARYDLILVTRRQAKEALLGLDAPTWRNQRVSHPACKARGNGRLW